MRIRKILRKPVLFVALLSCVLLGTTACGSSAASGGSATDQGAAASSASGADAEYQRALSGTGAVTKFIGEKFYDGKVTNEDEACKAVESVGERIGGDDTTKLELTSVLSNEDGTTYYTFRQQAGDVMVHGASVKLVVNKDGEAIGLVSAIMPNVKLEDADKAGIDQAKAEQVVLDACKEQGATDVKIVEGATSQTVILIEEGTDQYHYAWVVYTNNFRDDMHVGYLAHYVAMDGQYLYNIGVSEPGNDEALAGETVTFDFGAYEKGTWKGTVTRHDGSTMEVEVPTLTNKSTGDVYLADGDRKILCADYAAFQDGNLNVRIEADGKFTDNEVITYYNFIRVWDFYKGIGWEGPDGKSTPSLLLMDMVDSEGNPDVNAYYNGFVNGWQTFMFDRESGFGECVDVMAHEFTHCVTATTMTTNLYINDMGAINEGMSDTLGNLAEMMIDTTAQPWVIGENAGEPQRSMEDPHKYHQPEYVWDTYYGPAVTTGTTANDNGGVHTSSSLLNRASYRLNQAGMKPEEQFYFWMNVAMAMTPCTDYPQMAELLPWCLEQAGYGQYKDALTKAIEEARYTKSGTEAPAELPEGSGKVHVALAADKLADNENLRIVLMPEGAEPTGSTVIISWFENTTGVADAIVPEGTYVIAVQRYEGDIPTNKSYDGEKWVDDEEVFTSSKPVTVKAGETIELKADGLV